MICPQIDDAESFIVDYVKNPARIDGYSAYGYEIYLPNVIVAYILTIESSTEHISRLYGGKRSNELSSVFYEAAWNLCRRGVLRPGVAQLNGQSTADGASGNGYSVTTLGREWISKGASAHVVLEPGRLGRLFSRLAARLGTGFLQRANEAAQCHSFGSYLACCAMCGAAAESILLAVAAAKSGDETTMLAAYRASKGRQRTIDAIVGKARQGIAEPFRSATQLLSYWRDEAAHGTASTISEIEAHEALARLLRFAQFTSDNWGELVKQ